MRKHIAAMLAIASAVMVGTPAYAGVVGKGFNVKSTPVMSMGASVSTNTSATQSAASAKGDPSGKWVCGQKGWWWLNPDGTWLANTWAWLDGNRDGISECYYFGSDGYMLYNTITPDGYMVNGNGAWTANGIVQAKTSSMNSVVSVTVSAETDNDNNYTSNRIAVSSDGSFDTEEWADEVIDLVNRERRKKGRSELEKDDTLMEVAEVRAEEAGESFSHTRPDGSSCFTAFDEAGVDPNILAGENLAKGYASPSDVMNGWMHSSGHKANILERDYNYIGVGVYYDGSTYYWSQAFTG